MATGNTEMSGRWRASSCSSAVAVVTPYLWSATRTTDGVTDLTGYAPSDALATSLAASVTPLGSNSLSIASGAPAGFAEDAAAGRRLLHRRHHQPVAAAERQVGAGVPARDRAAAVGEGQLHAGPAHDMGRAIAQQRGHVQNAGRVARLEFERFKRQRAQAARSLHPQPRDAGHDTEGGFQRRHPRCEPIARGQRDLDDQRHGQHHAGHHCERIEAAGEAARAR